MAWTKLRFWLVLGFECGSQERNSAVQYTEVGMDVSITPKYAPYVWVGWLGTIASKSLDGFGIQGQYE